MSGGVWVASYVALWGAVALLLVMVLALVRQIGVLHGRLDEVRSGVGLGDGLDGEAVAGSAASGSGSGSGRVGAGEPLAAAEGPPLGSPAPMGNRVGYQRAPLTLLAFTSASCELSQVLAPALRIVDKQYDDVRVVDLALGPRTIAAFEAFNVLHTPFVVAVGQDGRVRGRGRARNLQQLEAFVERALAVAAKAAGRTTGEPPVAPVGPTAAEPANASAPVGQASAAAPAGPSEPEVAAESAAPAEPANASTPSEPASAAEPVSPSEPAKPSAGSEPAAAAEPAPPAEPARAAESAPPADPAPVVVEAVTVDLSSSADPDTVDEPTPDPARAGV